MTPSGGRLLKKRLEMGKARCLPTVRWELAVALGMLPCSLEPRFSFMASPGMQQG